MSKASAAKALFRQRSRNIDKLQRAQSQEMKEAFASEGAQTSSGRVQASDFLESKEAWKEQALTQQPLLLPEGTVTKSNQEAARQTFMKAASLVGRAKAPSKMTGHKITRAQMDAELKKMDELRKTFGTKVDEELASLNSSIPGYTSGSQAEAARLQREMERQKNVANGAKGVGGNSTAGQTKKTGTAPQSDPNPSAAGDKVEDGDKPGFFRRHWKATAVGSALTGLAATVGVANMMLAGGQQSNSNLYNPYQQQY